MPKIIPQPQSITPGEGEWTLTPAMSIGARGPGAREVAELLADYLRAATGFALPVTGQDGEAIVLHADAPVSHDEAGFAAEDYRLSVRPDRGVRIGATCATGLARGIQTLRQLLPPECLDRQPRSGVKWTAPAVDIEDYPRFRWRGQHLDVCRYFFSVDDVCNFIDRLALHRLNVCHLHLTEDQGWRVEIKRYPRLTEVGAWREETLVGHNRERPRRYDGKRYGGFFSQEDLRLIVAFAARRHIIVVPEIDMPGHMVAAVASYPELGNLSVPPRVRCHWGISQSVLNVEEETVTFMRNVLDEVMDIFPGRFIHIGGDEAPKVEWSESRRAQERMAELGLHSENELQSWFIRQVGAHVVAAGRRIIGWDEIMEGGLAEGAAVMSWRGEESGVTAAALGHDVVMAQSKWVYFDYYQSEPVAEEPLAIGGMTPTDRVYAYEPVPGNMKPEHRRHVLGCQGQLWTEYIPDVPKLDYMGFPRICALSEVLWLDSARKSYAGFLERLKQHRRRLAVMGVNAHPRP